MNVTEAIDQLAKFTDNLPVIDTNNDLRRTRILYALIEVCKDIRERDFAFVIKNATLTIAASGSSVSLPSDCVSLTSPGCGVFFTTTGEELTYLDPVEVERLQKQPNFVTDSPEVYSVFDMDTSGNQKLQVPVAGSGYTLQAFYEQDVPTLDESGNVDKLKLAVPARWHQSVVIPGVRAKLKRQRGAADWKDEAAEYEAGLRTMRRKEKPGRSGLRQIAPAFGFGR